MIKGPLIEINVQVRPGVHHKQIVDSDAILLTADVAVSETDQTPVLGCFGLWLASGQNVIVHGEGRAEFLRRVNRERRNWYAAILGGKPAADVAELPEPTKLTLV